MRTTTSACAPACTAPRWCTRTRARRRLLGAVRIAPGYFTDDEDLEHALGAIAELAR